MNHNQGLFDIINELGPILSDYICVFDNTSKQGIADGEKHFHVFLKGGIRFDVSKEWDEKDEYNKELMYCTRIYWAGPFNAETATDVLAVLTMLNHGKVTSLPVFQSKI